MTIGNSPGPRRVDLRGLALAVSAAAAVALCGCATKEPALPDGIERFSAPVEGVPGRVVSALRPAAAPDASPTPERTPVVFVHGTPGSARAWTSFLENPVPGTDPLAIDRPGFGSSISAHASGRPDRGPVRSYREQADAVAAHIDPANPAIVVGHSLGGPVVAGVAAWHPHLVRGVVIVAGSLDPDLETPRWFNHVANLPPITWLLGRSWRHANVEVFAGEAENQRLAQDLDDIATRVVIVHGTRDRLVPYSNVEYMRDRFVNASSVEVITLEGADHFLPWTHADAIRDAIDAVVVGRPVDDRNPEPAASAPVGSGRRSPPAGAGG